LPLLPAKRNFPEAKQPKIGDFWPENRRFPGEKSAISCQKSAIFDVKIGDFRPLY